MPRLAEYVKSVLGLHVAKVSDVGLGFGAPPRQETLVAGEARGQKGLGAHHLLGRLLKRELPACVGAGARLEGPGVVEGADLDAALEPLPLDGTRAGARRQKYLGREERRHLKPCQKLRDQHCQTADRSYTRAGLLRQ